MNGLMNAIGNYIGSVVQAGAPLITNYLLWKTGSTNRMFVSASSTDKLIWK